MKCARKILGKGTWCESCVVCRECSLCVRHAECTRALSLDEPTSRTLAGQFLAQLIPDGHRARGPARRFFIAGRRLMEGGRCRHRASGTTVCAVRCSVATTSPFVGRWKAEGRVRNLHPRHLPSQSCRRPDRSMAHNLFCFFNAFYLHTYKR